MTTVTLRGIDERMSDALKARARKSGTSVNAILLKLVQESLGLEKKPRSTVHDDLDALAGTWSAKDAAAFGRATASFEKVDADLWK